jgi:hypothetical protein
MWPWAVVLAGPWFAAWLVLRDTPLAPGLAAGAVGALVVGWLAQRAIRPDFPRWAPIGLAAGLCIAALAAVGGSAILVAEAVLRGIPKSAGVVAPIIYAGFTATSFAFVLAIPSVGLALVWSLARSRVGNSAQSS